MQSFDYLVSAQQKRQHAYAPHPFALLRARRERPRSRAAEKGDELATSHCPMPPVLPDRKDSTPRLRQETAALRDFKPGDDRFGSWLCENSSARATRRNLFDQLHL
jgi:hypothetical protein